MHLPFSSGRRPWRTLLTLTLLAAIIGSVLSPGDALAYALGDRLLSYGSRGQDVAQVQTLLAQAGYSPGAADGIFGQATRAAVVSFQKDHGLTTDGVVGPRTLSALRSALLPPAPPVPPPPPALPTPPAPPGQVTVLGYYDQNWSDDNDALNSLSAHAGQMDLVSPFWFSVNANGTVSNGGWNWNKVMQTSHDGGAKVLALFNNADGNNNVLYDATARRKAAQTITAAVIQNGLDGAVLDFESLDPSMRDGLTALVRDLAGRLHANGKLLAVAVGPKWSSDDSLNDGAAAYDYRSLGSLADYVQIMTYDQHNQDTAAGPVAALPWVESVAKYAVTQIPASKILLGVAGYGYEWPARDDWGVIYARDAVSLAASRNAPVIWDDKAQEAHFTYWDNAGTAHTVWFENSYSVEQKLDVVRQYGLGGIALWRLGQEDSRFWSVLP